MNYLAHCYLAFGDPEILIGQFIADDIKGKRYETFPKRIREGILLHRFVDHFTDTFPECLEVRKLLRPELGIFSGIALDVLFDHILACHWDVYHSQNQAEFIISVYKTLENYAPEMESRRKYIYGVMSSSDWLGRYKTLSGISLTLNQMSMRIPGGAVLRKSPELLETHRKKIEETFEMFFPQLISATKHKLDTFAA